MNKINKNGNTLARLLKENKKIIHKLPKLGMKNQHPTNTTLEAQTFL